MVESTVQCIMFTELSIITYAQFLSKQKFKTVYIPHVE